MNIGKHISIVGSPGSGKSTLSKKLSQVLRLPVIKISDIIDGYETVGTEMLWTDYLADVLNTEKSWITDGYGKNTIDYRLDISDTIIFLDLSLKRCLINACKRGFLNIFTNNTSAHEAYKKKLSIRLVYFLYPKMYFRIFRFHAVRRPILIEKLQNSAVKNIIVLHDRREIEDFLLEINYYMKNCNE